MPETTHRQAQMLADGGYQLGCHNPTGARQLRTFRSVTPHRRYGRRGRSRQRGYGDSRRQADCAGTSGVGGAIRSLPGVVGATLIA